MYFLFKYIDLSYIWTRQALAAMGNYALFIIYLLRLFVIDGSVTNIISPVKCMAMLFMCLLMPEGIALKELLNKNAIHSSPGQDPPTPQEL